MSLDTKLTERYAEYTAPMHDQNIFYPYEPSSPHSNGITTKYHHPVGGHKGNAAMSALTLLAFLFFLHILQQCLKDHMAAIGTPQVMIMTAGKEGEENIAKISQNNKIDKAGVLRNQKDTQMEVDVKERKQMTGDQSELQIDDDFTSPKTLLKIKTAEYRPENFLQKYKIIKKDQNSSFTSANFNDQLNSYVEVNTDNAEEHQGCSDNTLMSICLLTCNDAFSYTLIFEKLSRSQRFLTHQY